ncbi:hypothetical protein IG631_07065 [Alternaria alternata]|nr:hypothetical protein IG631_07065 [Alternaria alternata]
MKARVCDTHTDLNSSTLATPTCLPPSPILVDLNSLKHTIQSISASRAAVTDRSCPRAAIPSSFQLYPCSCCPARKNQHRRHGRPPTNVLATNCASQIPRFAHGNTYRGTSTYASRGGKAVSA